MVKPNLNVTPLIDVLLVLLVIFMIISPLKPSSFKAKIPAEPKIDGLAAAPNDASLVVTLNSDYSIKINNSPDFGDSENTQKLTEKLQFVFAERTANGMAAQNPELSKEFGSNDNIEKTVFIKAPKNSEYGKVVKVIDAVKLAGASPISLQIDDLNLR